MTEEPFDENDDLLEQIMYFYVKNRHIKIPDMTKKEDLEKPEYVGLFRTGQIVMTRGISEWIKTKDYPEQSDKTKHRFINWCLLRHVSGDCSDCCFEDWLENEKSIAEGNRTMSVYNWNINGHKTKIWIITEWDRSVTTVLFPDEY